MHRKTVSVEESASHCTVPRATTTGKKQLGFRPRRILAGIFAVLFLPWFPPSTATKLSVSTGTTTTGVLKELEKSLKTPASGKRVSQRTPAEFKAHLMQHEWIYGTAGTALPTHYSDPGDLNTLEAMRNSVQQGKTALALLPQVLLLSERYLGAQVTRPKGFIAIREVARLRTREGILHAIAGNHAAAVDAYLDSVQLGVHVGKHGQLLAGMTGELCIGVGLKELDESITHLSPQQAARAAERLERLLVERSSLEQLLESERDTTQERLTSLPASNTPSGFTRIPIFRAINLLTVSNYRNAMDQKIAIVRHPDAQTATALENHFAPYDPNNAYVPDIRWVYESYTQKTGLAQGLLTRLKIQAGDKLSEKFVG